ncbi:MAG: hypothetical protein ABSG72_06325 [Candidatus Sulfotelmatobacter sp.]|jgi:hypothetical protein
MSDSPGRHLIRPYRCSDCGSAAGFRSRRRTLTERFILPLLFLRPVRCGECFRRDYRLVFVPVSDRLSNAQKSNAPKMMPSKPMMPGKQSPASDRNVA